MNDSNLTDLISKAVTAKMTPEFIEKEVDTRVGKLIVESVDRALRSYSDTGKLIEKAIEDALRVDMLDLPSYGETVTKILKVQLESRVHNLVAGQLATDMDELLNLAPKEMKLSKIAEEMCQQHEGEAYGEVITVIVADKDYGSTWVYLDENHHYDDSKKYSCDFSLLIREDGTIAFASMNGRDFKNIQSVGRAYGLDQKIRSWYACGTKIILDEDDVCISVGDY